MKKSADLIYDVRVLTQNTDFSATSGVQDELILSFLNEAQRRIQTLITNTHTTSHPFTREDEIALVAGQEGYSLPRRLSYGKEVQNVEYSYDGQATNYSRLEKREFLARTTVDTEYPRFYYRRSNQIFVNGIPNVSQGKLRVMYDSPVDDLDKRRGAVASVAGLSSTTFTNLTVDSTADESSVPNLSSIDYICLNDVDGNVIAYNIPVGSYNTGTNVLTPRAGFVFAFTGNTVAAGSFITFGKWSTTHSKLADECEPFLVQYAGLRIFQTDSNAKQGPQAGIVKSLEDQIVDAVAAQTNELQLIPQVDYGEWF